MSDSTDLRSVIAEQMTDDTHVTNPPAETKPEVVETPQEKPVEQSQETNQDSFSQKIDTKGLTPEQLEEVYSKYQKAYTQKRQKEKEELRQYQEKLKQYESSPQGEITPRAAATQNTGEQKEVQRQFDLGNLSFEQYTQAMQRYAIENAERIAEQKFEELITKRDDSSNQEQMLQRFNSLDERFDPKFTDSESPEYNEINSWLYSSVASELGHALQAHINQTGSSKGFDSDGLAKEAIKRFDRYIDSVVTSKIKESTTNAQNKAAVVGRSSPQGGSSPSKAIGSRNLRDLISSKMDS